MYKTDMETCPFVLAQSQEERDNVLSIEDLGFFKSLTACV